jgi:protein SCO1
MKNPVLIFWLALAVVGSAAYGSYVAWRSMDEPSHHHSTAATHISYRPAPPPGPAIKDFQLVERSGREFDSKELAGHVWIGSFFFCNCPGPCWQMNQALKTVQDEFKDSDLRLVSITCDPRNDTPDALQHYAERIHADPSRWAFLTGDFDYIKRIGRDIFFQPVTEGGHFKSALVIDRNGKIRGSFDLVDPAKTAELKELVRQVLAEKAEPHEEKDDTAKPAEQKVDAASAAT